MQHLSPMDLPTGGHFDPGSRVFVTAWDRHEARNEARRRRVRRLRAARELAQTVVLAFVIFFGTQSIVQGREVEGPSMEPTYHGGQRVLVNRGVYKRLDLSRLFGWVPFVELGGSRYLFHAPERGEVIIFEPPFKSKDDLIKRVIGVPGDHVAVVGGRIAVNGRMIEEPYVGELETPCAGQWCDVTLDRDEYYVMGDNRPNSSDSRIWGPVRADKIVGKAWIIYQPFSDFGIAP